jgi:type IV pilus assembly protein PilW
MSTATKHRKCATGYTIVELMVAITISLFVLLALVTLFAGNSRERHAIERTNQQTEDGRYALQLLGDDLRDAGYLATLNPGAFAAPNPQLTVPTVLPDPCVTTVAGLNSALLVPVQGFDDGAAPACLVNLLADLRAGTDILVIRRTSTCSVGSAGCDPQVGNDAYFQASGCSTEFTAGTYYVLDSNVASLNLHLKDCATAAPIYQYRTHIYFIANDDQPLDGIPTLKRAELGPGAFSIVPLVEGVENLQIEYGLDTSTPTTGSAAVYTADPNTYNGCVPAACVSYWGNTIEAKINLLTRDLTTTQGYTDTKTYTLGLTAAGVPNTVGPFNDGYRRHVYYTVARLNNIADRNTP